MLLPAHGESKGKIGVFIEDHFDMTEYLLFNKRFPAAGFDLEYRGNHFNLVLILTMAGLKNILLFPKMSRMSTLVITRVSS